MSFINDFFNATILHSWSRVTNWRLREIQLNHKELISLRANKVDNELMQKYLAWRRSLLITSLPSVLATCIFSYMNVLEGLDLEPFNILGDITILTPILSPTVSFLSLCLGLFWWVNFRQSARIFSIGWILSLFIQIWPGLIPIDFLLQPDFSTENDSLFRIQLGIYYTTLILPLIITIPSGVVRGALRIRGLLPESSLAGWFLVLAAPMVPLLVFASVVLLCQLFGDAVLITATSLLVTSPCLYIFRRHLYTENLDERQQIQLAHTQRAVSLLSLTGIVLIGVWAIQQEIFPTFTSTAQFFLEFIGRSLTTTLVCADAIFRITVHQLKIDRKQRLQGKYAEVDAFLESLLENKDMGGKFPGWIVDETSDLENGSPEEDFDREHSGEDDSEKKGLHDEETPTTPRRNGSESLDGSASSLEPYDSSSPNGYDKNYSKPQSPSSENGNSVNVRHSSVTGSIRGADDGLVQVPPIKHVSGVQHSSPK